MPTYLSAGVYPREIDLSLVPSNVGPLRPAFIGTSTKGPLNTPVFCGNAQVAIDTFGAPSPDSYLMYAVLAFLEEGNQCYIVRVAIEEVEGQAAELDGVAIDTSGNRGSGWGRIPLFTGIDYGRITLRLVDADHPITFHAAGVAAINYNDADVSVTDGPTGATLSFTGGSGLSDDYIGCQDDNFIVLITGDPDAGEAIIGATYEVLRNSDSAVLAEGALAEVVPGESNAIDLGNGVIFSIQVTSGRLEANDTFSFAAQPDNRQFAVSVEGDVAIPYVMPSTTYTTVDDLVDAINTLVGAGDYLAIPYDDGTNVVSQLRTRAAGRRIQLVDTCAWAIELGSQQYAWDIPRSFLIGTDGGPFTITSQNNRAKIHIVPPIGTTVETELSLTVGVGLSAANIAANIDLAGVIAGDTYFESFELVVPGGGRHVLVATTIGHMLDQLKLIATFSSLKTLRFVEEIGVAYPYTRSYRGFRDGRLTLPPTGEMDPATPLSCEANPMSDQCAVDSAYFQNIVGWLVATSPGTWLTGYTASLDLQPHVVGDSAGRYQITIKDKNGVAVDLVQDVRFDRRADRYVSNILNPGTKYGGQNGNSFVNWDDRSAFLANDPYDLSTYEARQPSQFADMTFSNLSDGIPTDPAFSSNLDSAVIGNPSAGTGLYSISSPETYDINVLCLPGCTSGAVIGQGLQFCEARGDCLYIVDPPFGLRPQQVVDWHNGMLLSDLSSAINSSYGALYWGWLRIFDQYNSVDVWIPPSGHVSGVFARTARVAEQWYAPAGVRRGRLLTPLDVEYNPGQGERDLLYGSGNAVNPIVSFLQDGIIVWGQRTLQRTSTALDRVNVRMLLTHLKKNLIRILRSFVFEPNDNTAWVQVQNVVYPFLADVQARRGLDGFKVVCDETNNTPERRDKNQLWVSVFIKPTKAIEFIVLNLVILQSTASFSAEEVLAAGGIITAGNRG